MTSVDDAVRIIEIYLRLTNGATLTPVPNNLQPPSSSISGEVILPLCIQTPDFNSSQPYFQLGRLVVNALRRIIEVSDLLMSIDLDPDLDQACKDYNRILINLPTSAGRRILAQWTEGCVHTIKLSVNVAQASATLSCGHDSRYVAYTTFGDWTVASDDGGRIAGNDGSFKKVLSTTRLAEQRFEGTKYRLEFFLPPVRLTPKSEGPAGTKKEEANEGKDDGGKKDGKENQTDALPASQQHLTGT